MALLVILVGLVVPALARSVQGRDLKEEGTRFVSLTEYARSEAISQSVPVVVWVQPQSRSYGAEPKQGYDAAPGPAYHYTAAAGLQIAVSQGRTSGGQTEAATFGPDGTLDLSSAETITFSDRHGGRLEVVRGRENWGYEIAKGGR